MSTTVNMPNEFDATIRAMCEETMKLTVSALAAKYEFDTEEANRFMDSSPLKIVRKRGPSAKSEEKKSVTKEAKAKKKAEAKPKTKRGKTGYLLFGDDIRAEVREELAEDLGEDEKLKPQDVVTEIALRWKALEQDERDVWVALAKSAKSEDNNTDEAMSDVDTE